MTTSSTWDLAHQGLLGRLAACKEKLENIAEEADLDEVEGAIDELQQAIETADQNKMDEDADEDEGEEEEEDDEEE